MARIPPRLQGDIGELSAMSWLVRHGATVFVPLGHSPDVDLVADFGDRLVRVQSWSGIVKHFDPTQSDFLFVHVGDGRRWFIPSAAVEGRSYIRLGGPKYAAHEVEPDEPLAAIAEARLGTLADPWRGSRAVKGDAL